MDKEAVSSLGKIALERLSEATERAAKGQRTEQAGRDALSLLAALCEAINRDPRR